MKRIFYTAFNLILLTALLAMSQDLSNQSHIFKPSELVQKPSGFLNYLIDPSKFEMSQSYSLSYMSSGNRNSNVGLYLNTLTYQFSDPLMMQVSVGYMHQPFGGTNTQLVSREGSVFLQGAHVQYRPTKSLLISLDYESYPSMMFMPNRFGW